MTDTLAKSAQGVQFLIGDQATPTEGFDLIAEVTNFQGPGQESPTIETSSLDSTSKQYIGGLKDGGSVTMDFMFIYADTGQQRLRSRSGLRTNFKISLNDAATPSTFEFAAIIEKVPGVTGGTNAAQKVTGVSLKVTGDVIFTPGTP